MNDLPEDLGAALGSAGLAEWFAGCTAAHRREYLQWIAGAKRPEARQQRIARAVEMLTARRAQEEARARKPAPRAR